MKKIVIGVIALVAIGTLIFIKWRSMGEKEAEQETRTVAVRRGPIEKAVEATGEVAPLNRVEIKPPISGRIEKLLVDEGDHVKQGQILAWMSSSDRAAIVDAARA